MGTSNKLGKSARRALAVCALGVAGFAFALTAGCSSHGNGAPVSGSSSGGSSSGGSSSGGGSSGGGGGNGPTVNFSANPPAVAPGGTTTLNWTTVSAQGCTSSETDPTGAPVTGSGAFTGNQNTAGSFTTQPLTSTGAYTFTLICAASNGSQTADSIAVPVTSSPPASTPPSINFSASPSAVAPGQVSVLNWTTSGAQSCTASEKDPNGNALTGSGNFSGSQGTSGTFNATGLNTNGSYTFTLACVAAGGAQTIDSLTVVVASPPPTISFSANPSTVAPGSTTVLTWSTTDAASCTGSEADPSGAAQTGSGDFAGTQPVNGTFTTQALNSTGTYVFTLTCLSSSGAKSVNNLSVPVVVPTVTITPLSANPSSILYTTAAGNFASVLTWNHPEASSCTAGSTDPNGNALTAPGDFTGPQPNASPTGGFTTPQQTVNGTYTYTLTCVNGTSGKQETPDKATVTVSNPDVALTAIPNTVQVGGTSTLSWNHPTASACTASETDPAGAPQTDFNGVEPTSDGNHTTAALSTAGVYTFQLSCTYSGSTTPKVETATVTVLQNTAGASDGNCDAASSAQTLTNSTASGTTFTATPVTSGICLLCTVANPGNAVDPNFTNFATISTTVGLLGGASAGAAESLIVKNTTTSATPPYPLGKLAGMVVQTPSQVLGAGVLQSVTVSTLAGGVPTGDFATVTGLTQGAIKLQVLTLTTGATPLSYLAFPTTKPFDAIELRLAGLLNVNNHIDVYYGCVANPAP